MKHLKLVYFGFIQHGDFSYTINCIEFHSSITNSPIRLHNLRKRIWLVPARLIFTDFVYAPLPFVDICSLEFAEKVL